jgi:hypothetical protein
MPSGCHLRVSVRDDPNGLSLVILDHQTLVFELSENLLRIEFVVPELTVKLYVGMDDSALTIPKPADTTYNGQLKYIALASASRKPLPQYVSRAGFSPEVFTRRSIHCLATTSTVPESRLSEFSPSGIGPFFRFVQFVRTIVIDELSSY